MSALEDKIRSRDDETLLKMVTVDVADYRDDALEIARAELRARGRDVPNSAMDYVASLSTEELRESDLFCEACFRETEDEAYSATGGTFMRRLRPAYSMCGGCGSVIRDHCFVVFGMPVSLVARYRVKQLKVPWPGEPKVIASRRINEVAAEEREDRERKKSEPTRLKRRSRRPRKSKDDATSNKAG